MECAGRNMHNHCAAIYINVEQCDDTHLNEKTMSIISRDAAAEARNDVSLISASGQKISYFDCATARRTDKTERECAKSVRSRSAKQHFKVSKIRAGVAQRDTIERACSRKIKVPTSIYSTILFFNSILVLA